MTQSVKRISLIAVVVLMFTPAVLAQSSPVEARLVIPDAKVLPGVPFEMWIEVRNPSETTVTAGLFPHLLVRSERGDSFTITPESCDYPILLKTSQRQGEQPVEYLTLEPGEKRVLTLPLRHGLVGAQFFTDYRLSPPGRYTLAVRLDAFPGTAKSMLPIAFLGAVITNEAIVERIEPTGMDAKVWQRMQEVADSRWAVPQVTITEPIDCDLLPRSGKQLSVEEATKRWKVLSEILENYPDSNYVPYALLGHSAFEVKRALEVIERFPNSPVIELFYLAVSRAGDGEAKRTALKKLSESKRPTTRIRAFGREDLPKEPCPPEMDCEN